MILMLIAAAVAPADSALVNLVRDKHNRKQRCSPCGCCCRRSRSLPGRGGTEPRAAAPRAAWGGCGQRAGGGPGPRSVGGTRPRGAVAGCMLGLPWPGASGQPGRAVGPGARSPHHSSAVTARVARAGAASTRHPPQGHPARRRLGSIGDPPARSSLGPERPPPSPSPLALAPCQQLAHVRRQGRCPCAGRCQPPRSPSLSNGGERSPSAPVPFGASHHVLSCSASDTRADFYLGCQCTS